MGNNNDGIIDAMPCSFQDCTSKTFARSLWCPAHQKQKYAGKTLVPLQKKSYSTDPIARLEEKYTVAENGCWEWTACTNKAGYGRIIFRGKAWLAHRLSFQTFIGPIINGLHVCHHCDNPPCVNPKHLFLGTDSDNMHDMVSKGRHPLHNNLFCARGHARTPSNLYPGGACKSCRKIYYQNKRISLSNNTVH